LKQKCAVQERRTITISEHYELLKRAREYSKTDYLRKLEHQMRLYFTHFNSCRGYGGLRYKDEKEIECKKYTCKKARIVDSIWTLKELLTFRCFKTSIK